MAGLLFITAPDADHKMANRALWHLKDIEYGSNDRFHLVATRDISDLHENSEYNKHETTAGSLRRESFSPGQNPWANATLAKVESFVLDLGDSSVRHNFSPSLYVVIDAEGAETQTCIFGEKVFEPHDDAEDEATQEWQHEAKFDKVRAPWGETYSMWCNLDISNMDFADFCDQDTGPSKDGWWKWVGVREPFLSEDNQKKRDGEIERLRRDGNA